MCIQYKSLTNEGRMNIVNACNAFFNVIRAQQLCLKIAFLYTKKHNLV